MPIKTAIVLAGGAGLRLRPLTNDKPKAMVEVSGRPLLDWVLIWLKRNLVRRVVIGIAYKGGMIVDHLKDGKSMGLQIQYSTHTVAGGTAEGFRLAIERYVKDPSFFAINGDELSNVKLQELGDFHRHQRATATIAVAPLPSPYGVVDVDGADIIAFREKVVIQSVNVSVGVYAFQQDIFDYLPRAGDVERTAFPRLAAEHKLKAYRHNGFWMTVNTIKDLNEVDETWNKLCHD
jgi:NDP-sugar pyrophosphorylase family protein